MKDQKQIEKMAKTICHSPNCPIKKKDRGCFSNCKAFIYASRIAETDYCKQSVGEWEYKQLDNFRKYQVTCPFCKAEYIGNYDAYDVPEDFNFCPNCGAKMKGE